MVAGLAVARDAGAGGARWRSIQNAVGGILGPQDSWLLLRGLKTLAARLERQQQNAAGASPSGCRAHRRVRLVHYPGLAAPPGPRAARGAGRGFGAMVSFEVDDPSRVPPLLRGVRVFLFAESLGGVESLITFPAVQTHADIDPATRERLGINDRLLRLSVGIEDVDDLIADLDAALGR